jgi:hypothetical protein
LQNTGRTHARQTSGMSSTRARMADIEAHFPVKDEKWTRGSSVSTVTARQNLFPAGSQPIVTTVLRPKWISWPGPEAGYTPPVPNEDHKKVEL